MTAKRASIMSSSIWTTILVIMTSAAKWRDASKNNVDLYSYPVQSLNEAAAPKPSMYAAYALNAYNSEVYNEAIDDMVDIKPFGNRADAHAVHGIELSDGGYLIVGKAVEADGSKITDGFALKMTATGGKSWGWYSNKTGTSDAINYAVQLPNGGLILLAGWRTVGARGLRTITALNSSNGNEMYTVFFDDADGKTSAWETIVLASLNDESVVLLAGLHQKDDLSEMSFKSYGNVPQGKALVSYFPVSELSSITGDVTWTTNTMTSMKSNTFPNYIAAKAADVIPHSDHVYVSMWAEKKGAGVARLDSNLVSTCSECWGPYNYASQYEATSSIVTANGEFIVLTGQGGPVTSEGFAVYDARVTRVDASDGIWNKTEVLGVGGTKELMYNECWGIVELPASAGGGFAMSCAAGIEECGTKAGSNFFSDCNAGRGDPRGTPPVLHKAGVWVLTLFRLKADATEFWRLARSFKAANPPAWNNGLGASSSAAEWPIVTRDDGIALVTDEVFGCGILKFDGFGTAPR